MSRKRGGRRSKGQQSERGDRPKLIMFSAPKGGEYLTIVGCHGDADVLLEGKGLKNSVIQNSSVRPPPGTPRGGKK